MRARLEVVRARLRSAETPTEAGGRLEAEELWRGIIRLYSDNSELTEVVAFALGRLNGQPKEELTFSLTELAEDGES